jgi:hypothetical protein
MPLDFRSATSLFISTEEELATALDLPVGDVRAYRQNPRTAPPDVVAKLGQILVERGRGMVRVGEMLQEE